MAINVDFAENLIRENQGQPQGQMPQPGMQPQPGQQGAAPGQPPGAQGPNPDMVMAILQQNGVDPNNASPEEINQAIAQLSQMGEAGGQEPGMGQPGMGQGAGQFGQPPPPPQGPQQGGLLNQNPFGGQQQVVPGKQLYNSQNKYSSRK